MSKDKTKIEVEPPKRARKAIKKLHKLVDLLEYFCGRDSRFFRDTVVKDLASDIEDVLHELSIEKNIDHIRLATKLKGVWKKQQDDMIDEIIEERIEAEVEDRLDDIIEAEVEQRLDDIIEAEVEQRLDNIMSRDDEL